MPETVKVRVKCNVAKCNAQPSEYTTVIRRDQIGLLAIWFHSFHEGHKFTWWEDGQLVLGEGDVRK